MKYCSENKKLYDGADIICAECKKKYKEIEDINEPVQLCVVGGFERTALCGALKDAGIPFVEKEYGKMGVSNHMVTGYDTKLLNVTVLVPYSAFPKAYEIAVMLNLCDVYCESLVEKVRQDIEDYKNNVNLKENDKMSNAKTTTIKVVSAIAFLILVALVVFGTDYVMELIKNLLGG